MCGFQAGVPDYVKGKNSHLMIRSKYNSQAPVELTANVLIIHQQRPCFMRFHPIKVEIKRLLIIG